MQVREKSCLMAALSTFDSDGQRKSWVPAGRKLRGNLERQVAQNEWATKPTIGRK